jgi:hypothetical protein
MAEELLVAEASWLLDKGRPSWEGGRDGLEEVVDVVSYSSGTMMCPALARGGTPLRFA